MSIGFKTPDQKTRARMRAVRTRDSGPELVVCQLLRSMGYRFKKHVKRLLGSPDLVFTTRRKALFVHGCFWHGHTGCRRAATPGKNRQYWSEKIRKNRARDRKVISALRADKWGVLVVWECKLRQRKRLSDRLIRFLGPKRSRIGSS